MPEKTYEVEMLAFGDPGEIREVTLPTAQPSTLETLAAIFYYGQNDFQSRPHPSVSVGDVIRLGEDRYLVLGVGFHKLTEEEYTHHVGLPRVDRSLNSYNFEHDF